MPDAFHDTTAFRGARFTHSDLSDVVIRDCDVSRLRIVDSVADVVDVSGDLGRIVVNDVDVTDHVEAELNRRFPERARVPALATVDDYRDLWRTVQELWAQTLARFDRLPAAARDERVDGEWSLVETLRHLVAATDGLDREGRARPRPALPPPRAHVRRVPPELAASIGIERGATARYEEILPGAPSARRSSVRCWPGWTTPGSPASSPSHRRLPTRRRSAPWASASGSSCRRRSSTAATWSVTSPFSRRDVDS